MKRTVLALTLVMALSASIMAGMQTLQVAEANFLRPSNHIGIDSNGTVSPSNAPITRKGNLYTIKNDLFDTDIKIESSNIILDGANHWLAASNASGVLIEKASNVLIKNLRIESVLYGVFFLNSFNCSVEETTISNALSGIYLFGSNNILAKRNTVSNSWVGFEFNKAHNNTLFANEIRNNTFGFYMSGFRDSVVCDNILITNDAIAYIGSHNSDHSIRNQVYENSFLYNRHYISYDGVFDLTGRMIVFTSNAIFWDKDGRGNYWSDFLTIYPNATEIGNSGVGNTLYIIDANNIDHYPLMKPAAIPELPDRTGSIPELPGGTGDNGTDKTEPFPTLLVFAVTVTVVAMVAVGLLVYFKKRKR